MTPLSIAGKRSPRRACEWMRLICSNSLTLVLKLFILLASNFESGECLKLIMLEVPQTAYSGESIELSCIYELENDKLYSVKWIGHQLSKSGTNSVFLKYIDIQTAGVYRCEVSAEAPSFVTAEGEKDLRVTVLPTSGPQITGIQAVYRTGDQVNLNCTSAKSKPAAHLRWYINNHEAKREEYDLGNATHVEHADNLETSSLGLRFVAIDKHFKSGVIRVKCTSTVFPTRLSKGPSMSNEAILRGESTDMPLEQIFWQDNLKEDAKSGVAATQQSNSLLLTALLFISQSLFAFLFSIFSFGPRLGMP
ncbi:hypothetical protein TYRP_014481 [Tyrophagus putrescentiae]|nr:hypothetical protein TYRP_014481 [Tyrophagus putrescentiae]